MSYLEDKAMMSDIEDESDDGEDDSEFENLLDELTETRKNTQSVTTGMRQLRGRGRDKRARTGAQSRAASPVDKRSARNRRS